MRRSTPPRLPSPDPDLAASIAGSPSVADDPRMATPPPPDASHSSEGTFDPLPLEAVPLEIHALRRRLREFIERELLPLEREQALADERAVPAALRRRVRERARELGLFALFHPRELGGEGL